MQRVLWKAALGSLFLIASHTSLYGYAQQPASSPAAGGPVISLPVGASGRSAVEAIVATEPTTAVQLLQAVKVCNELGDMSVARYYLKEMLDANFGDDELTALVDEFGSPVFVKLITSESLSPDGRTLGQAVLDTYQRRQSDPANLRRWVTQLGDQSAETRYRALESLRRAKSMAVPYLVLALADSSQEDLHPAILSALARMKTDATGPLVAMLESSDESIVLAAIRAISQINARREAMYLVAPYLNESGSPVSKAAKAALERLLGEVPTQAGGALLLLRESTRYWDQVNPLDRVVEDVATWWSWNDVDQKLETTLEPTDALYRLLAARFARDAMQAAPESSAIRSQYIATQLEVLAYELGLDSALSQEEVAGVFAELGLRDGDSPSLLTGDFEQALVHAMENDKYIAAAGVARVLGQIGDAETLLSIIQERGTPVSPLTKAATHADRRLRFAACEAIVALDPQKVYPGVSDVYRSMLDFARSTGTSRAIVAGPVNEEASHIAGYLVPLGYEPTTTGSGHDVFMSDAIRSGDCELLLLDTRTLSPMLELFVQQLRQDYRTAQLPIAVYARADQFERAERVADDDPLTVAVPRPHTEDSVRWVVERTAGLAGDAFVPADVRLRQAVEAFAWLDTLYSDEGRAVYRNQPVLDVAVAGLLKTELRPASIQILAKVASPAAQTALIDLASRFGQPIADRQAAADAFFQNAGDHGILLTRTQIMQQYSRYNESEHQDAETQKLLGSILDWFEARM